MKVAIAGYGVEGEENYKYWFSRGHDVTIVDEQAAPSKPIPKGARTLLGPGSFDQLKDFELVVRTAGLSPQRISTEGAIWSSTNEFFAQCPAPIVGVTGTKGKGTTCSLLTAILTASGKTAHFVGNIGVSPLSVLENIQSDHIVVFEMSSFQLWDIVKSPHIAVVLQIEPDHLDVHSDLKDYIHAKSNIVRYQTSEDVIFYHPTNIISKTIAYLSPELRHIPFNSHNPGSVYTEGGYFMIDSGPICSLSALQIPGVHNVENACAAISVAKYLACSNSAIQKGLESFQGLPYRLEHVRNVGGIDYINDSFSSAPSATVAAIRSFSRPIVLILGGVDRSTNFNELKDAIKDSTVKHIVLIGEMRHKLASLLRDAYMKVDLEIEDSDKMAEIVQRARLVATPGDVVLLSPGCASFDMFKNFTDRGDQFRQVVGSL